MREFPLVTGEADYLLFVHRKAIGAVEAKPEGATFSGVETFFTNSLDPQPRSRRVLAFHRPEALAEWAGQGARSRCCPSSVIRTACSA